MKTLVVLPEASGLTPPAGVRELRRADLWVHPRGQAVGRLLRFAWSVRRASRGVSQVVLVTGGVELFLLRLLLPRTHLVAADWLMPRSTRLDRLGLLRRVRFVVIRQSDGDVLARRFRVSTDKISFVHFPRPEGLATPGPSDPYLYSAGWAHRDWDLLLAAQRRLALPLVVAGDLPAVSQPGLTSVGPVRTPEGRSLMAAARAVVLPFKETELPSGPLVLLDALAMGKAVVVSDVGGARDYVRPGESAVVVPAGDLDALAAAMARVWSDDQLRERLGASAQASTAPWTARSFWSVVLAPTKSA